MLAMWPDFVHALVSAVPSSIAAAMVIAEPVLYEIVYNLRLCLTFAGKCQQRVITMRARRGTRGRGLGRTLGSDTGLLQRGPIAAAYLRRYAPLKPLHSRGACLVPPCARATPP